VEYKERSSEEKETFFMVFMHDRAESARHHCFESIARYNWGRTYCPNADPGTQAFRSIGTEAASINADPGTPAYSTQIPAFDQP
jgi:hypothetical protein